MRRMLIGFLLTLFVLPASAADAVPQQVGAFLVYCNANSKGCTNEIGDISFGMLVTARGKWCPAKETDDVNVLTPKVVQWLIKHPETNSKTTDDGIELALVQLYPCKH